MWRWRYVFTTERALVYQHVKKAKSEARPRESNCSPSAMCRRGWPLTAHPPPAFAQPTGPERVVPFDAMLSIKALTGGAAPQLLIQVPTRDYIFQMTSEEACERWAANLVQLAQHAGHTVRAFVVGPPSAGKEEGSHLEPRKEHF